MARHFTASARLILAALLITSLAVRPAAAQSILRDTETEALFDDMARPLAIAAGLDPKSVKVVLIGDPSINAFVMQGQPRSEERSGGKGCVSKCRSRWSP